MLTARDVGRLKATDDEQLLTATDLDWLLVTHNQDDYELLHRAWHSFARRWGVVAGDHAGVIVVPQSQVMPYPRTAGEIDSLVRAEPRRWGRIFEFHRKWGWIERP